MHRSLQLTLALSLILLPIARLHSQVEESKISPDPNAEPGVVIVKVKAGTSHSSVSPALFGDLGTRFGVIEASSWIHRDLLITAASRLNTGYYKRSGANRVESISRIYRIRYSANESPLEVSRALSRLPFVEYAEPSWKRALFLTPNDPSFEDQWYLGKIKAPEAWDLVTGSGEVIVAVVDAGIDTTHPDLAGVYWHNPGETGLDDEGNDKRTNNRDDDGNRFVDDWWGYDFSGADGRSPDNDPTYDNSDHGVAVSGVIGAVANNGIGIAGAAYGVKLMGVKIGDDSQDRAQLFRKFDGVLYAAVMGAHVINCSWGGENHSVAEQEVIDLVTRDFDALVVSSAGNDVRDKLYYPASFDNVLSVAGTTSGDSYWSGSNYNHSVDLSAPGVGIYTTGGAPNRYASENGTSFSAPLVSAAAALLLSRDRSLTPLQLSEILRASSDDISGNLQLSVVDKMGAGRLNMLNAVTMGDDVASARVTDLTIDDANGNGILEPGEQVTLRAEVTNILAAADDVSLNASFVDLPAVDITNASLSLGAMTAGGVTVTPQGSLTFTVPADAGLDRLAVVRFTTATDDRTNKDFVLLRFNPSWMTTDLNRFVVSFNSVGNFGYNGTDRLQGDGIVSPFDFRTLLWHGGLMIGTAADRLVDAVRVGPMAQGTGNGFEARSLYRLSTEGGGNVEIGRAEFTDRESRIGLDVDLTTYEFKADSTYVLAVYDVKNTSSSTIENLFTGLYADWDMTEYGSTDKVLWNDEDKYAAVLNESQTDFFIGMKLVSDQTPTYYGIDQGVERVSGAFADSTKWRMLSTGIANEIAPQAGWGDVGVVVGGGPVTIAPGETEQFAFAFLTAGTIPDLTAAANAARERYLQTLDVDDEALAALPRLSIAPTPTTGVARIGIDLKSAEHVRIEIVNQLGEVVAELHDGRLGAGPHIFSIEAGELPAGVYECRLIGKKVRATGRLLVVR